MQRPHGAHKGQHLVEFVVIYVGMVSAQPSRLHIRNGCKSAPIWIAHEAAAGIGPDPQNVRIDPGSTHYFSTPDGLSATRYWPKMGCDDNGNHCIIGGSGGPGQACVRKKANGQDDYSACAPPIDTKFEATFGRTDLPCDAQAQGGCDYVDISLVDGWTLPFRFAVSGPWCSRAKRMIDCAGLNFWQCPASEYFKEANVHKDLKAVNPNTPDHSVAGCYSPCSKLAMSNWKNDVLAGRADPRVSPYCCPTPPVSPEACRAGPIINTTYVETIRRLCPDVYAYSFDDSQGLMRCHPSSEYSITFLCPAVGVHPSAPKTPPNPIRQLIPAECSVGTEQCVQHVEGRPCQCGSQCPDKAAACCPDYEAACAPHSAEVEKTAKFKAVRLFETTFTVRGLASTQTPMNLVAVATIFFLTMGFFAAIMRPGGMVYGLVSDWVGAYSRIRPRVESENSQDVERSFSHHVIAEVDADAIFRLWTCMA